MSNIERLRKELSPERKRKIAARAATIIAEERSLQELRRAHKLTQKKMAEVLGVGQDSVSRLEQRSDLLISTLRGYVEAMGGEWLPPARGLGETGAEPATLAERPTLKRGTEPRRRPGQSPRTSSGPRRCTSGLPLVAAARSS